MEDERRALAARMTDKAAKLLLDMPLRQMRRLEEMRFYAGQNACFVFDGRSETQNVFFSQRDVDELVTALCGHSRYAYETQLTQGYIPLGNGCRAGACVFPALASGGGAWRLPCGDGCGGADGGGIGGAGSGCRIALPLWCLRGLAPALPDRRALTVPGGEFAFLAACKSCL